MAWARIVIGVHFPLDIAEPLLIAGLSLIVLIPANKLIQRILTDRPAIPLYRLLFAPAIKRGWCH